MHGDRRARVAVALVTVLAVACTTTPERDTSRNDQNRRPNVLIIVTDDQPIGTLDVMPKTRRYFVTEGITFTNTFSSTPACCPARASIMTGRYAHNHGVLSNEDAYELDQGTTLQAHLQANGYHTGLVGKFLNLWKGRPPNFDRWALKSGARRTRYLDTIWQVDGGEKTVVPGYWTGPLVDHVADILTDANSDHDERPWFLWVALPAPHAPYVPAPDYEDAALPPWQATEAILEQDKSDKPPYVRSARSTLTGSERARGLQLRSLMSADDAVGQIMETLEELDEDNTLAFFVSDNGYLWGDHGLLATFLSKGNPYSRSVRVPMLMRWPERVAAGTRDERLTALVDIAPTIYDATGVPAPAHDGRSLLDTWNRNRMLNEYWQKRGPHRSGIPDWASLRTARFNYIEYHVGDTVVFREYYDLVADPGELENLLGDGNPDNDPDVEALHRRLTRDRNCEGSTCP